MSGHSKWATTKHKKAIIDSKRSKNFSKLSNSIAIAARHGKDPSGNPTLRDIIAKAHAVNMPNDNIERAIKRGSGEIPGVSVDEYLIELYGPAGTAFLIKAITDSKNRTLGSVKSILNDCGGRLAETGSVKWMFSVKVRLDIPVSQWHSRPELTMPLIDAGAEEIKEDDEFVYVFCDKSSAEAIKTTLAGQGITPESNIVYVPNNPVALSEESTIDALRRLAETLEECDDIDSIYFNAIIQ